MSIISLPNIPEATRLVFADFWIHWGDHFRDVVDDDTILIDALWVLMPPYVDGAQRLYRGEIASNLRDRTYGMCWTTKLDIARGFAEGARIAPGGTRSFHALPHPTQSYRRWPQGPTIAARASILSIDEGCGGFASSSAIRRSDASPTDRSTGIRVPSGDQSVSHQLCPATCAVHSSITSRRCSNRVVGKQAASASLPTA